MPFIFPVASSWMVLPLVNQGELIAGLAPRVHPADFWLGGTEKTLTMEEVRVLRHFASQTATGAQKLAIIQRVESLRPEAANALLKLLEEPPVYLQILLLGENEVLLPTLVSRVQKLVATPGLNTHSETSHIEEWRQLLGRLDIQQPRNLAEAKRLLMYQPLLHSTIQQGVVLEGFSNLRT